jgi:hypothetical protein
MLQDEIGMNFLEFSDDVEMLKHVVVDETNYKDCTQALVRPKFDNTAKLKNEEEIEDNQIDDMLRIKMEGNFNERQLERNAGFYGSRI